MGLAIPRPAMRNGERKWIQNRLARHYALWKQYETEGMDRETASAKAYEDVIREENKKREKHT